MRGIYPILPSPLLLLSLILCSGMGDVEFFSNFFKFTHFPLSFALFVIVMGWQMLTFLINV